MFGRFRRSKKSIHEPGAPVDETLSRLEASEGMLHQVVGPEDGACVCDDWVGAVISLDGTDSARPSLAQAVADGLFHRGCRHSLRALSGEDSGGFDSAEADFRTRLAVERMQLRRDSGDAHAEERFTRLYDWARRADRAGSPAVALALCEAALQVLHETDIFQAGRAELERILKARVATIRARLQLRR